MTSLKFTCLVLNKAFRPLIRAVSEPCYLRSNTQQVQIITEATLSGLHVLRVMGKALVITKLYYINYYKLVYHNIVYLSSDKQVT